MPTNDPRPSKAARRDEARQKALELRKEQERKAKRTRILAISGLAVAVLGLGGVIAFIASQNAATKAQYANVAFGGGQPSVVAPTLDDVETPAAANDDGGIPVSGGTVGDSGDADNTVVSIYFDFMCPYCGQFDRINSADLEALSETDGVTVLYQPLSFLDEASQGTSYSTRAANALAVVADRSPEHVQDFITALYAEGTQPAEGTKGLTDEEIADLATGVGVPEDVAAAFTDTVSGSYTVQDGTEPAEREGEWRTFAPWVAAAYTSASEQMPGLTTPTILIDGEKWTGDWQSPGVLKAAVEDAAGA